MQTQLSRRAFLAATGTLGVGCASSPATSTPDLETAGTARRAAGMPGFVGLQTLQDRRDRLLARYPGLLTRQVVGQSRNGRPIELVTLGGGARSALVVAGIHANEPTGCLVADLLMHELTENDSLRRRLDTTWHFINPLDPDGFVLNEGWFSSAPSLSNYFRHFYRPALARQSDYTFPLKVGSHEFSVRPPENLAFQAALDIARPQLLFPLHSCDFGGAFFILSRSLPTFESRLRELAEELGVPVSAIGEPFTELAQFSRGVFEAPRPHEMIRSALEHGVADPRSVWPAGGSSMEYADRYGALSVVIETPGWETRQVPSTRWTLGQIVDEQMVQLQTTLPLMEQWTPETAASGPSSELAWSCAAYLAAQRSQIARLPELKAAASGGLLSASDTASLRIQLALIGLRGPATLLRVLAEPSHRPNPRALQDLQSVIRSGLAAVERIAPLEPTHRPTMIALQARACLEAAQLGGL